MFALQKYRLPLVQVFVRSSHSAFQAKLKRKEGSREGVGGEKAPTEKRPFHHPPHSPISLVPHKFWQFPFSILSSPPKLPLLCHTSHSPAALLLGAVSSVLFSPLNRKVILLAHMLIDGKAGFLQKWHGADAGRTGLHRISSLRV